MADAGSAKELLAYVPAAEVQETKRALEVLQLVQQQIDDMQQTTVATKAATDSIRSHLRTDKIKRWLCPPDPSINANHAMKLRHEGTVHSKRPLTLAEAKEVIATRIENEPQRFNIKRRLFCDTNVLDYYPSLVTVIHATNKELHLAHFSIKEYLVKADQFNIMIASISITRTCLTYLTDINGSHKEIKQDFPMARYAAEVWTGYAALAQALQDIAQATARFLGEEATFQRWAHINAQGGYFSNALYAAVSKGHEGIVRLLLDNEADINAQGGYFGNALQAAASKGHEEIFRLLERNGTITSTKRSFSGTPSKPAKKLCLDQTF
ncbi:Pfs, NACHT and Ankyrin domain protein [Fusarium austroafricanum]|uniref:Pfs, NACHT and Ankyrin domain protein n=1 Tax=Fusarium austroafricanum TaxID=2364996 RepID=A0A8H4P040_9HYPO|nr:Pfs, NACHT and Ankyrin domain protein [Fusarium austroafricanum]